MVPKTLIERCCLNDSHAETELWILVKSAAHGPVRSMLSTRDYDITFVEDVMQEMVLIMAANNRRRLRAFRGVSEGQFRAYLRMIAIRLAQDMMRKLERTRQFEAQIDGDWASLPNEYTGETIMSVVEEIEVRMSTSDRVRFRAILRAEGMLPNGTLCADAQETSSKRTLRRWKLDLFRKYFHDR